MTQEDIDMPNNATGLEINYTRHYFAAVKSITAFVAVP